MKLHCYPETDSLYIELASAPGAEAREIVEGLVVDLDADGNVVGLRKLDLSKVETIAVAPGNRSRVISPVARMERVSAQSGMPFPDCGLRASIRATAPPARPRGAVGGRRP